MNVREAIDRAYNSSPSGTADHIMSDDEIPLLVNAIADTYGEQNIARGLRDLRGTLATLRFGNASNGLLNPRVRLNFYTAVMNRALEAGNTSHTGSFYDRLQRHVSFRDEDDQYAVRTLVDHFREHLEPYFRGNNFFGTSITSGLFVTVPNPQYDPHGPQTFMEECIRNTLGRQPNPTGRVGQIFVAGIVNLCVAMGAGGILPAMGPQSSATMRQLSTTQAQRVGIDPQGIYAMGQWQASTLYHFFNSISLGSRYTFNREGMVLLDYPIRRSCEQVGPACRPQDLDVTNVIPWDQLLTLIDRGNIRFPTPARPTVIPASAPTPPQAPRRRPAPVVHLERLTPAPLPIDSAPAAVGAGTTDYYRNVYGNDN